MLCPSALWKILRNDDNTQAFVDTLLYLQKFSIWRALWAVGIIGLFIFKNEVYTLHAVNGERYIGGCLCGRPLVPTRWRYMPYSQRNNQFIEGNFW